MVTLDAYWLTFVISVVLPMLVALIAKQNANETFKAVLLLLLAAINGTLTSIAADGGTFDWKAALIATIVSFVTAVGVHFGLLRPAGVTGADGAIQRAVPRGLGQVRE